MPSTTATQSKNTPHEIARLRKRLLQRREERCLELLLIIGWDSWALRCQGCSLGHAPQSIMTSTRRVKVARSRELWSKERISTSDIAATDSRLPQDRHRRVCSVNPNRK